MNKKEQKLKRNLYKALTKYFIHNAKNSLSSSESILDQLASFRMETGLPAALRQDKKYQKAQKKCNKANEKIQDLNLTPQQWDAVDAAITAENISSIEYEYSCAVTPQVRQTGNRLSGLAGTAYASLLT